MRATITLCVLITLATTPDARAGKLLQARTTVRDDVAPKNADRPKNDRDSDVRDRASLAAARQEVRKGRSSGEHHHSGSPHHGGDRHRASRHSHGRSAFGFFTFDYCEPYIAPAPYCPPAVVETHIYHHPAPIDAPATAVLVPTYPSDIRPTFADSFFGREFAPYPYASGCGGFMVDTQQGIDKTWSGQVQIEAGSGFDGLNRRGASLLAEGATGFGVNFDWQSYTEELPAGGHDELHVGELGLLYRIAESDYSLFRIGVGAAWLGDRYDTDLGVNFTLQADLAPRDPLVLSGELDLGTLGDAQHLHAAGTVGIMLNRCEVYGGYDYRRIGAVAFEGPMIGLRIWF